MMYYEDLTPYEGDITKIAVGWLDEGRTFRIGVFPKELLEKLKKLSAKPVELTRGYHTCDYCGDPDLWGNGEIHIPWVEGKIFVAPAMIWHYIEKHDYMPPKEFIEALKVFPVE